MRFALTVIILLLSFHPASAGAQPSPSRILIIDPGHGGVDLGAKRRWQKVSINEAQLTWGLAQELVAQLAADSIKTYLTTMQVELGPEYPRWQVFGRDTIPSRGADIFWAMGKPPIRGDRLGLEQRLIRTAKIAQLDTSATVLFISLHFDYLARHGRPAGSRIIHSAGPYDTMLVSCLATALDSAQLLWYRDGRFIVANGKSGLGRHLMVLRQSTDPRKIKEHDQARLIYNIVHRVVLIEMANLANDRDWQRLQLPGALRMYAAVIAAGLRHYWQPVATPAD